MNPVVGLFAVGFLGRIRTQRHRRRRREVGVSSWPDFEATFPSGPPRPGSPDRPPGTADIAANWDPSAAPPTRP